MQSDTTLYDVIIVGGGQAGLSAALYAARRGLKVLLVTKDLGGQAARTPEIENYPGLPLMNGFDIMDAFAKQAQKFGARLEFQEVTGLTKCEDETFSVHTPTAMFITHTVILAFGLTPRDLGVPGETQLRGRGVSYCPTCDGSFFKGKIVAVAGGSIGALDASESLSRLCKKVYLIHQGTALSGNPILKSKVEQTHNITIHLETRVLEILGKEQVAGIKVQDAASVIRTINLDGIFVEMGYIVKSAWVKDLVTLDKRQQVIVNQHCETSTPGIFAAGDATTLEYKQVVISAGEGAKAALAAYKYIQLRQGKRSVVIPDWGF